MHNLVEILLTSYVVQAAMILLPMIALAQHCVLKISSCVALYAMTPPHMIVWILLTASIARTTSNYVLLMNATTPTSLIVSSGLMALLFYVRTISNFATTLVLIPMSLIARL